MVQAFVLNLKTKIIASMIMMCQESVTKLSSRQEILRKVLSSMGGSPGDEIEEPVT